MDSQLNLEKNSYTVQKLDHNRNNLIFHHYKGVSKGSLEDKKQVVRSGVILTLPSEE